MFNKTNPIQNYRVSDSIPSLFNNPGEKFNFSIGNDSEYVFTFLLLIVSSIVLAITLLFLLTDPNPPLSQEILIVLLGVANFILVYSILDIARGKKEPLTKKEIQKIIDKTPSELLPQIENLPGNNWEKTTGDELRPEEIAWKKVIRKNPSKWGFKGAFVKVFKRKNEKAAFSILKFSSVENAKKALSGIREDWKDETTYPVNVGEEAIGIHSDSANFDGTLLRILNILAFVLIYREDGMTRRESARYTDFLPEIS